MNEAAHALDPRANRWPFVVVVGVVVLIDQIAKSVIGRLIGPDGSRDRIAVIGDWLALDYVENSGLAFGLFAGRGQVAIALAVIALTALVIGWAKGGQATTWQQIGIGLIVGGAVANLVDRFRLGHVIDYIDVGRWPTFNLADAAITVGVLIMAVTFWQDGFGSTGEPELRRGVGNRTVTQPE